MHLMHVGLAIFTTDETISPAQVALEAEQRGFESLLFPDHTHIPVATTSTHPRGAELTREYLRLNDVFVAVTAAATVTTTLNIGTCVCLLYERDPITTAKTVATIDSLSNGRVIFGVGGGWIEEEMRNHGVDPQTRFRRLREHVLAMKEIWTNDEAEFHGEFVDFDPILSWPKPARVPNPPVLLGGTGPRVLDRVVEYADGWVPVAALADFKTQIPALAERAAEAGRGPIPVSAFRPSPELSTLSQLKALGVARVILGLPAAGADVVLPLLDEYAKMIEPLA